MTGRALEQYTGRVCISIAGKFTQSSVYVTTAVVTRTDCISVIYILSLDTFTVTQAVNAFGFGRFQVKLSLFTGLCWMADSMEMTILSILSPALHCEWHITRYQQALTTTVSVLNSVNAVHMKWNIFSRVLVSTLNSACQPLQSSG
jgi:hypothetical protein